MRAFDHGPLNCLKELLNWCHRWALLPVIMTVAAFGLIMLEMATVFPARTVHDPEKDKVLAKALLHGDQDDQPLQASVGSAPKSGEPPKAEIYRAQFALDELSARYVWAASDVAETCAFLVAIVFFGYAIACPPSANPELTWSERAKEEFNGVKWSGVIAVGVGIAVLFVSRANGVGRSLPGLFGLLAGNLPGFLLKAIHERVKMEPLNLLVDIYNGIAGTVIVMGIFAVRATIMIPNPGPGSSDSSAKRWADMMKKAVSRLQDLLSLCSGVMIIGVIQIDLQYRWAATVLSEEYRKSANVMADSASIGAGTVFAILMVALFGSAALSLRWQITSELSRLGREQAWIDWQQRLGLEFSLQTFYVLLAKALAPVFVAGLSTVLSTKVA
jgi:hypothetical protein